MQETLALDDFDHRLLDLVRQNNLTPARELATGHVDFILYVVVPDMEAYDTFTREALSDDDRVRNFTTLLTIREVMSFDPSQRVISRTRS